MKVEEVRYMIDGGLRVGDDALEKGYVDGIMNEEQLLEYLGITKITMWEEADGQIMLPERDFSSKYVAVIYGGRPDRRWRKLDPAERYAGSAAICRRRASRRYHAQPASTQFDERSSLRRAGAVYR